MSSKRKLAAGVTVAILAVAGVAWAADFPDSQVEVSSRTLVPVDGAGTVTLEVVGAELDLVAAAPEEGWTVTVERSVGRQVEARFAGPDGIVRVEAELEDGEIRVDIERTVTASSGTTSSSSTSSPSTTSVTNPSSTSSTSPASTSSTTIVTNTSTTSVPSSTSTTVASSSTSTTIDATTSTTSGSTSTTMDDNGPLDMPDGTRTYQAGAAGSITVQISGGWLSLVTVNPGPGWSHEVEKSRPDDIEVEFDNGDDDVKIRVRNHDGQLEVRVDGD